LNRFFEQLKTVLIEAEKEHKGFDACGYFETMLQHADKLTPIIQDAEQYDLDIRYEPESDEDYNSAGKLYVYVLKRDETDFWFERYLNYHYVINLSFDERYWGYCECKPGDEGYDPAHDCCGMGCDWVAPSVSVSKVEGVAHFSFDGYERDMWALRAKWIGSQDDYRRKQIEVSIADLDKRIAELIKQRDLLKAEVNQ
jgi:hypothetical protein